MKFRKATYIAFSLGAAVLVFTGASQWKAHATNRAAAAAVIPPKARAIVAAGRVEPETEEIKIGSELDGKLKIVTVDEGAMVKRGQVLAILENGDAVARVSLMKDSPRRSGTGRSRG